MNGLSLKNVGFSYRSEKFLHDLSGNFNPGKYHLVLGRAGSGKTTLLMLLAGFLQPGEGEILFGDSFWKPQGKVCLSFQNPEMLFFQPSVGEEIEYALLQRGLSIDAAREKAMVWAQEWGLNPEQFWNRHPSRLSGGEKRRVALAACTVFEPQVVLLDEPSAGLDASGRAFLKEKLVQLGSDHVVIVVTHDPEELLENAGVILVLGSDGPRWFSGEKEFLAAANAERGLYPLPGWYVSAVSGQATPGQDLPSLSGKAVATWLRGFSE